MRFRPGSPPPQTGFQSEGVLVLSDDATRTRLYTPVDTGNGVDEVPTIRVQHSAGRVVVSADGPVQAVDVEGGIVDALVTFGDEWAERCGVRSIAAPPSVWCSWYQYFLDVTPADIEENLAAIDRLDLPFDVVQVDDGWQAGIGDWDAYSERFRDLPDLVARIRDRGRRAGIWVAPLTVGSEAGWRGSTPTGSSARADRTGASHCAVWTSRTPRRRASSGLPACAARPRDRLRQARLPLHRCAPGSTARGAHPGRGLPARAGRSCARLSARTPTSWAAAHRSCPASASSTRCGCLRTFSTPRTTSRAARLRGEQAIVARAWQHGRFWVNDPDCLVARPGFELRRRWADLIDAFGGLRSASDRIQDLDDWGVRTTRRLLSTAPPPSPFDPRLMEQVP